MNKILSMPLAAAMTCAPWSASACAVCFGQTDSKLAVGMNMGILALLVVIGAVLAAFASFFIFLARRSASLNTPGGAASPSAPSRNK